MTNVKRGVSLLTVTLLWYICRTYKRRRQNTLVYNTQNRSSDTYKYHRNRILQSSFYYIKKVVLLCDNYREILFIYHWKSDLCNIQINEKSDDNKMDLPLLFRFRSRYDPTNNSDYKRFFHNMRNLSGSWLPRWLTLDHKHIRMNIFKVFLVRFKHNKSHFLRQFGK